MNYKPSKPTSLEYDLEDIDPRTKEEAAEDLKKTEIAFKDILAPLQAPSEEMYEGKFPYIDDGEIKVDPQDILDEGEQQQGEDPLANSLIGKDLIELADIPEREGPIESKEGPIESKEGKQPLSQKEVEDDEKGGEDSNYMMDVRKIFDNQYGIPDPEVWKSEYKTHREFKRLIQYIECNRDPEGFEERELRRLKSLDGHYIWKEDEQMLYHRPEGRGEPKLVVPF